MVDFIGIYEITISPDTDRAAFEASMRNDVFPRVRVGKATRGGTVTAQYLLRQELTGPGNRYSWIVGWETSGGSPFGAENTPPDPTPHLNGFGATASFTRYELVDQENTIGGDERDA